MSAVLPEPVTRFSLPPGAEAAQPPEHRGLARDAVRLLVGRPTGIEHRHFRDLPDLLAPGDLVVVNTSATLPAAVHAVREDGGPALVHVSGELDDGDWVVELRRLDGSGPDPTGRRGQRLVLADDLALVLGEPYPRGAAVVSRLWRATPSRTVRVADHLGTHGRPIRYAYVSGDYPLADYQTVFATHAGSAEMASAGRPFTPELVVRLLTRGVVVAPVTLHAGVSSPDAHEGPLAERFDVPAPTARLVNATRSAGGRVVAVGTTVTRALESAAAPDGHVSATRGWTDVVLGPDRPPRVVSALVTGLHPPEASHLLLLEAVAGPGLVAAAYAAALTQPYLWHEFGDSSLFLP